MFRMAAILTACRGLLLQQSSPEIALDITSFHSFTCHDSPNPAFSIKADWENQRKKSSFKFKEPKPHSKGKLCGVSHPLSTAKGDIHQFPAAQPISMLEKRILEISQNCVFFQHVRGTHSHYTMRG